jgi:hypothetical protein
MNDRIDALAADVDELARSTTGAGRERPLQVLGAVMMTAGIVVAVAAWIAAGGENSGDLGVDNAEQNEWLILALAGVATTVAGSAVFLRYSLARFFRLWLLRQLHETRTLTQALRDR